MIISENRDEFGTVLREHFKKRWRVDSTEKIDDEINAFLEKCSGKLAYEEDDWGMGNAWARYHSGNGAELKVALGDWFLVDRIR